MQLLYTLTTYPPSVGGAQLLQHLLAQQLSDRHSVQVITHWDQNRNDWLLGTTLCAPSIAEDYTIDGINVHRMGIGWQDKLRLAPLIPLYYPCMSWVLPAMGDCLSQVLSPYAAQADLVHNVRIGREGLSYASLQVARQHQLPFVLTPVHHPRWIGWRYQEYLKLYRQADRVIALTQTEKSILTALGVKAEKISVTGMGPVLAKTTNPEAFRHSYTLTDAPIILFLGQHYAYKGYRELLLAAPLVWQTVPEAQFVFIGPAVGQSEQHFQANLDPRIHRLGKVDLQTKTDAIAACSLLCVPSSQESFGGVYTEAWSFAKPVIGCHIPAVAEVISEGVNGYLVSQHPAEISDRICDLLLNPTQAEAMGLAGQQKVASRYTWAEIARLTEQAYQQCLGE